jgi:hypothetical protein
LAVDVAGDVFFSAFPGVSELPVDGGPKITLDDKTNYFQGGISVDGIGDLFFTTGTFVSDNSGDYGYNVFLGELPAGARPLTLQYLGYDDGYDGYIDFFGLTADSAGDIFSTLNTEYQVQSVREFSRNEFAPLNFGVVPYGTSATLPLGITNTGNRPLTITPAFNNPEYRVVSSQPENCLAAIPAGQSCTLQVELSSSTVGTNNGLLTLDGNGASSPTVQLLGAGLVAPPVFSLPSGVFATAQTMSITSTTPGAAIYYTTNGTLPSASSARYGGPILVSSTERLNAVAIAASVPSAITTAAYTIIPNETGSILNYDEGFATAAATLQFGGTTVLDGSRLQLTGATEEGFFNSGIAYSKAKQNIQSFATEFAFQLSAYNTLADMADGITFTIENGGPRARGTVGKGLGYQGVGKSMAIKFDTYDNAGEGPNSTGLYTAGALPTIPSINLAGSGIDLHSGDIFLAELTYDGAVLNLTLTDTITQASWSHSFAIDIPATVGGNTAYVGFTGATGGQSSKQEILSWTYVSGAPGAAVSAPPAAPPLPQYAGGFSGQGMAMNGAWLSGTALLLSDGGLLRAAGAFYERPENIQSFTTDFTLQATTYSMYGAGGYLIYSLPLSSLADGMTFTIQTGGPYALGGVGGLLGYGGVPNSVAIKFDLHDNAGEGSDSTGLYVNGAAPTVPSVDLTDSGIDLHSGDAIAAHVTYNGAELALTLTDTVTLATWSHSFAINIPATIGSNTAFVGFTGATGGESAAQYILNWTFTNP